MTITEKTWVDMIYFLQVGAGTEGWNFMGTVQRPEPGAGWMLEYRFRYFDARGDEYDKKNWYRVEAPDQGKDKLNLVMREMGEKLERATGMKFHAVEVKGNGEKFAEVMKDQDWINSRAAPDSMN